MKSNEASDLSIAMKIGYMHCVLDTDNVLAECGVWHAHEDDECEIADNWVIMRKLRAQRDIHRG